jgi:predicted transcriptional regulator
MADNATMPKELISVRVASEVKDVLFQLAEADRRTVSWMAEAMILEALHERGLLPATLQQTDLRAVKRPRS